MPLEVIVFALILLVIASIILGIAAMTEGEMYWPWAGLSLLATVALVIWLAVASNAQPVETGSEDCEIVVVKFPDGRQVQMFTSNGVNHNANEIFHAVVPDGYIVRRTSYRKTYDGIYFSSVQDKYKAIPKEIK